MKKHTFLENDLYVSLINAIRGLSRNSPTPSLDYGKLLSNFFIIIIMIIVYSPTLLYAIHFCFVVPLPLLCLHVCLIYVFNCCIHMTFRLFFLSSVTYKGRVSLPSYFFRCQWNIPIGSPIIHFSCSSRFNNSVRETVA